MTMITLLLAVALIHVPLAASAAGRVVSTTGKLTSGGMTLRAGDALPDAEVRLDTGTATLAIDGGRFLLKGPARLTPRKTVFHLQLGSLLSVLKKRIDRTFSVSTPIAVAAVRGTDFFTEIAPNGELDVCICRGGIEIAGKGMKPVPMAADNHLHYRFAKSKSGTTVDRDPPPEHLGHDDDELHALHALLNAEKP
jgi:hypothetical protein